MALTLGSIVDILGGELHGDPGMAINGLAPLESAASDQLSFLSRPSYHRQLATSLAGCVIVGPQLHEQAIAHGSCIVAADPYLYFARVTQLWKRRHLPADCAGIHPAVASRGFLRQWHSPGRDRRW